MTRKSYKVGFRAVEELEKPLKYIAHDMDLTDDDLVLVEPVVQDGVTRYRLTKVDEAYFQKEMRPRTMKRR